MDDYSHISCGHILQIIYEVEQGEANPEQVRELFDYFCHLQGTGGKIPKELLRFVAEGFSRFLGGHNMEKAFGLTLGPRGPRKKDEKQDVFAAYRVLQLEREDHKPYVSVDIVAKETGRGTTQIDEAAKKYRDDANGLLYVIENYSSLFPGNFNK